MSGRLFSSDYISKRSQVFHPDDDGDSFVIEDKQDVGNIIEVTKASYNSFDERAKWGDINLVASIPAVIADDLWRKGILQDEKALRKWLDDPDNEAFRMRPGRLSRGR